MLSETELKKKKSKPKNMKAFFKGKRPIYNNHRGLHYFQSNVTVNLEHNAS